MTTLRTRFIEDMQLHGYSPKTQSCYVHGVRGLARFYSKSPDLVSEEELRRYFLHLTLEKKVARPTATIALCAIKFFSKTHSSVTGPASNSCARPGKRNCPWS